MTAVETPALRMRETLGRIALAASVVVFLAAGAGPAAASDTATKHPDSMCVKVVPGAGAAFVNGVDAVFTWTDDGVDWTTGGAAQSRHFRVTVKSDQGTTTVWGETGHWSGTGIRSISACYCPEGSTATTTKPSTTTTTKPTTTTEPTTEPTEGTQPTVTEATVASTSTTRAVVASSEATTTTAPPDVVTTPTTEASVTTEPATTPTTQTATSQPGQQTTTRPTLLVLAAGAAAQDQLPDTGLDSSGFALFGAALVVGGWVLVRRPTRARGAHRR